MSTHQHPVEDAIRRSHCAHADSEKADHRCVGTCTISPKGLTLECRLCGDDYEAAHPYRDEAAERAKKILAAAGISWRALSDEARADVERAIYATLCPGCGIEMPPQPTYRTYSCACGEWWWSDGWKKKN